MSVVPSSTATTTGSGKCFMDECLKDFDLSKMSADEIEQLTHKIAKSTK